MPAAAKSLTSGRLLAQNTIWNLVGMLLPMIVGVAAFPILVRSLGVDRFGLLSLAWILIGYFTLFDMGLGRALTKLIADRVGASDEQSIPPLVWISLLVLFLLGIVGGAIVLIIAPWLVRHGLTIPSTLQGEALGSIKLLAASIPLVTVTSGLRGVLEARQGFAVLNLIRIPMSIFLFLGPVRCFPFLTVLCP